MFKTYEELKEKFPVGTIYCIKKQEERNYYYDERDIQSYLALYSHVKILDNNLCLCIRIIEYKVDGYLFDGEYWYPAKRTWDGWDKIDEDEINMEGF